MVLNYLAFMHITLTKDYDYDEGGGDIRADDDDEDIDIHYDEDFSRGDEGGGCYCCASLKSWR